MRLLALLLLGCQHSDPILEIAQRDWKVHELALLAGEKASECPAAGAAMQVVIKHYWAELAAASATTLPEHIGAVTAYIEAHPTEFPDLDDRWDALRDRCPHDAAVQQAFRDLGLASPAPALPKPGVPE